MPSVAPAAARRDATEAGNALLPPVDLRVQRGAAGQRGGFRVRRGTGHAGPAPGHDTRCSLLAAALLYLRLPGSSGPGWRITTPRLCRSAKTQ